MASFTSDTQNGKILPIGVVSAEQRDREDREWRRSKELAAARLAGKIEGLKIAVEIVRGTLPEYADAAIRAKIAELEATTTQETEG